MLTIPSLCFANIRGLVKQGALFFGVLGGNFLATQAEAGGVLPDLAGEGKLTVVLDAPEGQFQCLTVSKLPSEATLSLDLKAGTRTASQSVEVLGAARLVNLSQHKELSGAVVFSVTPENAILRINAREISPEDRQGAMHLPAKPLEVAAYLEGYEAVGRRVTPSPCGVTTVQLSLTKKAPAVPVTVSAVKPEAQVGEFIKDCDTCPQMVVVPAGSFVMGEDDGGLMGDAPARRVDVRKPFAVSIHEITFDQWDACVAAKACGQEAPEDEGWGRQSRPVINVSWEDAQDYVSWLSLITNRSYRLLSEAEWEYVARAGTTTPFWWGINNKKNQANCADCKDGSSTVGTEPVGRYKANAFGLFDTVGNVWEWTQDCYSATAYGEFTQYPAPYTSAKKCARVLRGGAWDLISQGTAASIRFNASQKLRSNNIGLRVARDLKK